MLTRRRFLQTSAMSSAALLSRNPFVTSAGRGKKVIVAGAGLAGLTAAFELMQSGNDVTVLEARMRPGGRVHTLRDAFPDGLYAEAGAIDFGDGCTLLLHYIRLFNLPVVEVPFAAKSVAYVRGTRLLMSSEKEPDWPLKLTPQERKLGRAGLIKKYMTASAEIGDPLSSGWPSTSAVAYDRTTLDDLLRQRGLSEDAVALCNLSLDGQDYDHLSALQNLSVESFYGQSKTVLTIRGGNDQLPKTFAQRLGERLDYGSAVVKLEQTPNFCRVTYLRGGKQEQVDTDYVVLAIPFSVLRNVEFGSSISASKRAVISNLRYESIMRIYLQAKRRFWTDEAVGGSVFASDLPSGVFIDHSSTQPGERGIIESQTEHENARRAKAMSAEERVKWALENAEKVHPGFVKNFEGGTSFCWDDEQWSRGAWAYYAPGQMTAFYPHVAAPEGRIHFAGEHTSALGMTMEGAIESGIRAAREIIAAA